MMPPLRLLLSPMLVALVAYTGTCVPGFVGAQTPFGSVHLMSTAPGWATGSLSRERREGAE